MSGKYLVVSVDYRYLVDGFFLKFSSSKYSVRKNMKDRFHDLRFQLRLYIM